MPRKVTEKVFSWMDKIRQQLGVVYKEDLQKYYLICYNFAKGMKECSMSILTVLIQEHYDQQFPPNSTNKTTKMEPT